MVEEKLDVPFSQSILNSNEDQVVDLTASQLEWKSKKIKEEYRVVDFMYGMFPRPIKIQTTD